MIPAIVVSAFNRPKSLARLLKSLDDADYSVHHGNVKLVISIDFSGKPDTSNFADSFVWRHGEKEVIKHPINLGLRKHILSCGELTQRFGSIILLEDDLYVSSHFYTYTLQSLSFYDNDANIAGISLYTHSYNETTGFPFSPLDDNSDIFFLQIASSWGQAWNAKHWRDFKIWYDKNPIISSSDLIPNDVKIWPESSWKKYFIKYLVDSNKYFVYPKKSLTTNFADAGTHVKSLNNTTYQVPLILEKTNFNFKDFEKSLLKYDAFCELMPDSFKKYLPDFNNYDLTVDLYGSKGFEIIKTNYLLTTKRMRDGYDQNIIRSFGLQMKPMEMNIILQSEGNEIFLIKNSQFPAKQPLKDLIQYEYFFTFTSKQTIKLILTKIFLLLKKRLHLP